MIYFVYKASLQWVGSERVVVDANGYRVIDLTPQRAQPFLDKGFIRTEPDVVMDYFVHNASLKQLGHVRTVERADGRLIVSMTAQQAQYFLDQGVIDPVVIAFTTNSLVVSSPVLSNTSLKQKHLLAATSLAVHPFSVAFKSIFTATSLVVQPYVLGTPLARILIAVSKVTSVPVFGAPLMLQKHVFVPMSNVTASPAFGGFPIILQKHAFAPTSNVIASPVFGTPLMTKLLVPVSNVTASPVFGTPVAG